MEDTPQGHLHSTACAGLRVPVFSWRWGKWQYAASRLLGTAKQLECSLAMHGVCELPEVSGLSWKGHAESK